MIELSSADQNNIAQVYSLINTAFREPYHAPHNMQQFFPYLFNDDNMDNIRIVKENGAVLSVLCYIPLDVEIDGCVIKVASVGSVCTRKNFEGKGYATMLLQDCIGRVKALGADLLLLVGHRELYSRNNIHATGTMYDFTLKEADFKRLAAKSRVEAEECSEDSYGQLYDLYNMEKVRYVRENSKVFTALVKAAAWPRCAHDKSIIKVYKIKSGGSDAGYAVIAIVPEGGWVSKPFVVEYAGSRAAIVEALGTICQRNNIKEISSYVSAYDVEMLSALKNTGIASSIKPFAGRLGIMNFTQMMEKLRPWLERRQISRETIFSSVGGNYIISDGTRKLIIKDDKLMHDILFGSIESVKRLEPMLEGSSELLDSLLKAFPLPLVYPLNLNLI